ncbi:hypothetical protein Pcinc_036139 [Petrolisthes cinctipes]|uniref:Uncharacterized protein n=1 Tax=Petrolisthes cinctipes TaxID=88211 RepID=A0AAE1EPM8_PETCI|nr:hypothetical protein Pcinc_036139 [Petrolisthes cinctipes]
MKLGLPTTTLTTSLSFSHSFIPLAPPCLIPPSFIPLAPPCLPPSTLPLTSLPLNPSRSFCSTPTFAGYSSLKSTPVKYTLRLVPPVSVQFRPLLARPSTSKSTLIFPGPPHHTTPPFKNPHL